MKKYIVLTLFLSISIIGESQTEKDLFNPNNNIRISWLGIDFSHVKLIGDFSQFNGAGEKNIEQIRDIYFPAWNKLILNEPDKYDIKGMLNKDTIFYDIDMIMKVNSNASFENMESYSSVKYTEKDLENFIAKYNTTGKDGVGILFIAESLNKIEKEGCFHFIALNLSTKELLFHRKYCGKPKGFGLRNYWAGSIYKIIKEIKNGNMD